MAVGGARRRPPATAASPSSPHRLALLITLLAIMLVSRAPGGRVGIGKGGGGEGQFGPPLLPLCHGLPSAGWLRRYGIERRASARPPLFRESATESGNTNEPRPRRQAAERDEAEGRGSTNGTAGASTSTGWDPARKDLKICSVRDGLDLTRLRSFGVRAIFRDALEDVELIREVYTEAAYNGGLRGGFLSSNLTDLESTFDWTARNATAGTTTLDAGLGYVDDRRDRRMDRWVGLANAPLAGMSKGDDFALADAATSNILPWLYGRRSREGLWPLPHQNGRSEGDEREPLPFDALYAATWAFTWGDAVTYYPPLNVLGQHPFNLGDAFGDMYDGRANVGIQPALEANNPSRSAVFTTPYADVAHVGLSMLSAVASIYYTGRWRGRDYEDTFLGTAGIDITLDAVADIFDDLDDALAQGSFALLADAETFSVVATNQNVVEKIYPQRTGFEEERVARRSSDNAIIDDRRNQTYLVSDTIWQPLTDEGVASADWGTLHRAVLDTPRGDRDYRVMDVTLTGDESEPRPYYAMFDRWEYVSDWVLLVLAPIGAVDGAVRPSFSERVVALEVVRGDEVRGTVELRNGGTLDLVADALTERMPPWVEFANATMMAEGAKLPAGGPGLAVDFVVRSDGLPSGTTTTPLTFRVRDDDYDDCLYDTTISFQVEVRVSPGEDLNQLGNVRVVGLALCALVLATAVFFAAWVVKNRRKRVVRASQPHFLYAICFGCFVMGSTIIPLSIDDGVASVEACDKACMAAPWLFSVGFVTAFAALFAKIWRLTKVFNTQFKKIKVTERDVLYPFAVLFTANFILLLAWTLVDPLRWFRVPLGDWSSYGTCAAEGSAHIGFIASIAVVDLSALVMACIQAYRAREISDEYSETKYIAVAIVGWLQVALIGIPLFFLVVANPTASFFVKTGLVFIISASTLLLMFVPKMIHTKNSRKNAVQRQKSALRKVMARASTGLHSHTNKKTSAPCLQIGGEDNRVTVSEFSDDQSSDDETGDHRGMGSSVKSSGLRIIDKRKSLSNTMSQNVSLKTQLALQQERARSLEDRVELLERILKEYGIDAPDENAEETIAKESEARDVNKVKKSVRFKQVQSEGEEQPALSTGLNVSHGSETQLGL